MKSFTLIFVCIGLLGTDIVCAQEEPAATNGILSEIEPLVIEEVITRPPEPLPLYKGSDMPDAFRGAAPSRFGVSGRVNKMPAKKSKKREKGCWRGKLDLGLSTASGNSDFLRYNGSLTGSRETEKNYYYLKAAGRYGESDQKKDTENATGEIKHHHRLSDRMYSAVDGHVMHDGIADLSYRVRGSLSLGHKLIWTDRAVLTVEAGPGYVEERKGGEETGFVAGRLAQYLEILVTDSLQIWQSVEYFSDITDAAVYFINAEVGLETVLIDNLSLRFTVEDRYDSNPAEDKKSNDLLTTTSFVWNF